VVQRGGDDLKEKITVDFLRYGTDYWARLDYSYFAACSEEKATRTYLYSLTRRGRYLELYLAVPVTVYLEHLLQREGSASAEKQSSSDDIVGR